MSLKTCPKCLFRTLWWDQRCESWSCGFSNCGYSAKELPHTNFDNPLEVGYIAPFQSSEDYRQTGLKNGIRQLTNCQIIRTLSFEGTMAVDDGNFVNGCFCPLAVGVGLDRMEWKTPPTDAGVAAILHLLGYRVNNTRGIKGNFFRDNRLEDYRTAAREVLKERGFSLMSLV